jgi:DNA-binding response OmpR family regulator
MSRILIVEDDADMSALLRRGIDAEGHETVLAEDGEAAAAHTALQDFDLLVLDLGLPDRDGLEILRDLRATGSLLPVIILTGEQELKTKVAGLEIGADDYITKPFEMEELLARIRTNLRVAAATPRVVLEGAGVILDLQTRWATLDGERIELSEREFALLETFMRHPGRTLTKEDLLETVWGLEPDPASNVVEVYVGYLRRKLGSEVIETVRHAGYRLGSERRESG